MAVAVAFIIPGFTDTPKDKRYWPIAQDFRDAGIEPVMVDVNWKWRVMSDYVTDFVKLYKFHNPSKAYIFGFSFGAMISFLASVQVPVETQILGSISSYFKENIPLVPKSWLKYIGKKRVKDFLSIDASSITKRVGVRSIFLFGDKGEEVIMSRLNNHIYEALSCEKERYFIPGSGHDIGNPQYQKKVRELVLSLK